MTDFSIVGDSKINAIPAENSRSRVENPHEIATVRRSLDPEGGVEGGAPPEPPGQFRALVNKIMTPWSPQMIAACVIIVVIVIILIIWYIRGRGKSQQTRGVGGKKEIHNEIDTILESLENDGIVTEVPAEELSAAATD
ncbi:MAG: hypothetical protein M0R33_13960 [Methylomonas sp.]|jgi:hypothetical protein|uniref:hypothetical protein n=1 Tax=Methylomonas sp. TaxID=418 RepID=UPI0025D0BA75|nr:hypothetical protein [Methylomonas sp.]MCK9607541.1 hypothetical protein [Methylomonas sp.]